MKKILHWLACHTVILVLLVFLAIAVFFRGPLFGIWPEPEKTTTSPTQTQASSEQPGEAQQSFQPEAEAKPAAVKPEISAQKPVSQQAEPQSAKPAASLDNTPAETPLTGPEADPEYESDTGSLPNTVIERTKPEILRQEENYQFRPPQEEPYQPVAEDSGDKLQKARKAYWNDDLQKSRSLYEQYIAVNPQDPDGYGELGNLLSTMGDLDKAAQMYRKAADLLISKGEIEQAQRLEEVLSSIEVIQNMPE